jgi:hypothetical protein
MLYWHWSPWNDFDMDFPYPGLERMPDHLYHLCIVTQSRNPKEVYNNGYMNSTSYINDKTYYGIKLPLGFEYGGLSSLRITHLWALIQKD